MKKFLFIFLLASGAAQAQFKFPKYESIGDTAFFRIEEEFDIALNGFQNMLNINGYAFEKRNFTPKKRIIYLVHAVDPKDENHVYFFYLLHTVKGYEAWYEYRSNQDCIIENDNLFITYEREN